MHALTPREIEHYHEYGFVIPDFRLSEVWLGRLRDAVADIERNHPSVNLDFVPSPHVPGYVPGLTDYDEWLKQGKSVE